MTAHITITLESDKKNTAGTLISPRKRSIHVYGKASYDSDSSAVANQQLNFVSDSSSLGTNTTDSSGNYNFAFQIAYDGNYTFNTSYSDSFNNYGSNATTLLIRNKPLWVKYRWQYHLGSSKVDDIYRIGTAGLMEQTIGSDTISNLQYANNLSKYYICTYDQTEGVLLSLIHSYKPGNLNYVNFSSVGIDYTLELQQQWEDSQLLVAYTKGSCSVVDSKFYLVKGGTIPSRALSSFNLGTLQTVTAQLVLSYDRLDINGTDTFAPGTYQLCIKNNGLTPGNRPIVDVRSC
jgi:hypothetical protein